MATSRKKTRTYFAYTDEGVFIDRETAHTWTDNKTPETPAEVHHSQITYALTPTTKDPLPALTIFPTVYFRRGNQILWAILVVLFFLAKWTTPAHIHGPAALFLISVGILGYVILYIEARHRRAFFYTDGCDIFFEHQRVFIPYHEISYITLELGDFNIPYYLLNTHNSQEGPYTIFASQQAQSQFKQIQKIFQQAPFLKLLPQKEE